MVEHRTLEHMVQDICALLERDESADDSGAECEPEKSAVYLWDDKTGSVPNGISYGKEETEP